ncbi:probable glucuronosyltransferase Os03g0107900 [Dendrobium catenatum]|uniref:Putative glucuronosyltransferase n=1 Tax=Dendrobium catenatum TaxID=906689 RepID=A0A2I0X5B7_9ASPA|nr:probable glucuronosyltransferase Os03g0107900 [Dendrobium catenatum]PKU83114.1 putative glucuronosyltransferase [Dendrobium catenatum]
MGSVGRGRALFTAGNAHQNIVCGRAHQIGALALIAATFFLTRALDRLYDIPIPSHPSLSTVAGESPVGTLFQHPGFLSWPNRGYGTSLSLKIYVYEESEVDGLRELMRGRDGKISAESCAKGQWGTQVKIHHLLLKSKFRTSRKEEADLFFVPSYVKCVRMNGGLNDKEINHTYVKVLGQMPYFRLSGGRDHVFVFPSGAGAHLFRSWAVFLNRSIILTPEGDRTDKRPISSFHTWKDIIIPGNVDDGLTTFYESRIVQPIPLSKRKYLANFLGRAQGKVGRLQLLELAKQYPDKLESPELQLTGPNKLGRVEYFTHLRNAKFCLSPRGESSWTLRFYESFFVECVPVILSDQIELPFQNVIDYTLISIKWPSTQIGPQLLKYLESIPDEAIESMIAGGREVRCLWVYLPESEPCSAMLGILWELQRKVRRFHQSVETFWLHNQSIVNREFVEFHGWRTPLPLP